MDLIQGGIKMVKESYSYENEFMGRTLKESFDIKVTDEGVDYIMIEDSNFNISHPSWHLIKTLYERIKKHLDYFEEMKKLSEDEDEYNRVEEELQEMCRHEFYETVRWYKCGKEMELEKEEE